MIGGATPGRLRVARFGRTLRLIWDSNRTLAAAAVAFSVLQGTLVLDQGRIAASGGHAELMRRGGLYARMFETQARHYHDDRARAEPS